MNNFWIRSALENPSSRFCLRAASLWLIMVALLLGAAGVRAQNSPNIFTGTGGGDPLSLLDGGNWITGLPSAGWDAIFDGSVAPAIFTLGTGATVGDLTVGSLNVITNAGIYSIRNDTSTATTNTLTLGGGTGNAVPGSSALDLIYVTNSATLNLIGTNGSTGAGRLAITLAQNGNFDIKTNAALLISADINGAGFSVNKTGVGALTISGNFSGSGGVTNVLGFYTNIGLSTYTGPTVIKGGTNVFNSITTNGGVASALGSPADAINGTIYWSGGLLRYIGSNTYTSDRIINMSFGGTFYNDISTGKLILTGGITNNNNSITFRGLGTFVVSGQVKLGTGSMTRTDGGLVIITNQANLFSGIPAISDGKFYIDTIANTGVACSIGSGSQINLGQNGGATTGTLQLAVTNGSSCDRTIFIQCTTSGGGLIENTIAGTTVTFSGNVTNATTNVTTSPVLTLTGVGNGVISGVIGLTTNTAVGLAITKTGTGTWALSGANTNRGVTTVSGGTLLVNGNSIGATNTVTVANIARFGGSGTVGGSVTMSAGGGLVPGGSSAVGTLTLTNNLFLNGNALFYKLANSTSTNDVVAVGNVLTVSNVNYIYLSGESPVGTNTLMTFASRTGPGTFVLGAPYPNVSLITNATSVQLAVTASFTGSTLTWKGYQNGVWDGGNQNWLGGTVTNFNNGNDVIFDDTPVGNTTNISSGSPVLPNSVTFNNATTNYTISAAIGGSGPLTKNGGATAWLYGANNYSGNTIVNAGALVISNSGAINSPLATLNVGADANNKGTVTLGVGGAITVKQLLSTNVVLGGLTNSVLNLNAGTLTTSNAATAIAANTIVASNTSFSINGSWKMNGGTNFVVPVNTNGTFGTIYIGNGVNNAVVTVNSNAVFSTQNPWITTNVSSTNMTLNIGNGAGFGGNQLIITNGGRVIARKNPDNGSVGINVGAAGNSGNSIIVAGADGLGNKAVLDLSGINTSGNANRLIIGGNSATATNNFVLVGAGGMISNVNLYCYNGYTNGLIITNGGQVYPMGVVVGRTGFGNYINVAGADSAGNRALLAGTANYTLWIGGSGGGAGNAATNCIVYVGQNGVVTNITGVNVGPDTNSVGNSLVITNGGQLFSSSASFVAANQALINASSNYVIIGGSFGSTNSQWNLGKQTLTIGTNFCTNNFVTLNTGGVMTNVASVILGGANSLLTFNGGKLAASASGNLIATNVTTVNATNFVQTGGAIIDSGTNTVTAVLPFLEGSPGGGGLTKLGSGTLTLAGVNTYGGSTLVSAGRLVAVTGGSSANSAVTVLAGATNSVQIVAADGQWTCAALTQNDGSTLDINFGVITPSTGFAPLNVAAGTVALTNVNIIVRTTGGIGTGQYPLIKYLSYVDTLIPSLTLPVGMGATLSNNILNNSIDLVVTTAYVPPFAFYWAVGNGNWDINTTMNWKDTPATGVTNMFYTNNYPVVLDDSASGTGTILVTNPAPVSPSSLLVDVTTKNYTISGAAIAGNATLTKINPGTLTLNNANTYAGDTLVNGGTLVVANGGAIYSPTNKLNIGSGATVATNTLASGGAITVQTLLATNTVNVNNSVLNFTGGTLTTSNNNGLAASILLASNTSLTLNSSWNLNGGTNIFANAATNPTAAATVNVGNGANNVQVNVNSNAFWWHAIPANSSATNALNMQIGNGAATNNVFSVNGGLVTNVNQFFVGSGSTSISNQLIITNGGQFIVALNPSTPFNYLNGSYGSIIVGGTNGAGQRATLSLNRGTATDRRIYVANATTAIGNLLRVDAGGVITNAGIQMASGFGNTVIITNGGQIYLISGICVGRNSGNSNSFIVAGFDGNGSNALVSSTSTLDVGGSGNGGNSGTNNWAQVDRGGMMKVTAIRVGGSGGDSNSFGNSLIITNGGQVTSTAASSIAAVTSANSNSVVIGGSFGTTNSQWNLGNQPLTIGTNFCTNNFVTLNTGGILTNVASVILGGANSLLTFNGGTLAASASGNLIATNSATVNATNFVQSGGAIIDTVGFTVTNQLPLLADPNSPNGGLTKLGVGTLTLAGVNTYTGPTLVSTGKLLVTTAGSSAGSAVTVLAGATNSVQVLATASQWTCAGLTQNDGSTLDINFASAVPGATAPLQVNGNVALTNVNVSIRSTAAIAVGQYPLIKYTGTQAGALVPASLVLPTSMVATISNNTASGSIDLVVTTASTPLLYWAGGNGNWNFAEMNWKDTPVVAAPNVLYQDAWPVVLDDSASGAGTILVTNTAVVSPLSVVVDATAKSYTISGSAIAGGTTLTKSGSAALTLSGANTYTGNTTVKAGVLVVTNGGAITSPAATLNVGPDVSKATNTLASGGAITVQTLLATNVSVSGVNNSILNFTGGTLTTSNNNGVASSILLPANTSWTNNANWNLNGGTNILSNVATNGNPGATVYVGNSANNVQVNVNPNAVLWLAIPTNSIATNTLGLQVGVNNATNNVLAINGGTLIVTNKAQFTPGQIQIGVSGNSIGNQMIITNGGQVFSRSDGSTGPTVAYVGFSGSYNSLLVAGTNGDGQKSTWNLGFDRLQIGSGSTAYSNNTAWVSSGGVLTNANLFIYGYNNSLTVTNGGQIYPDGLTVGRSGYNSRFYIGGADNGGNKAIVYFPRLIDNLIVGGGQASVGGSNPGTNNLATIDANGVVTNVNIVYVGGNDRTNDTACVGNGIVITNGGQLFSRANSFIGGSTNCDNNYITVGGGSGQSLWSLNNATLTLGTKTFPTGVGADTGNYLTLFGGGVVTNISSVILGGTNSVLNFNGGTLAAGANGYLIATNVTTVNATNFMLNGGAIIDTVAFTVTNELPLLEGSPGGGGLTKHGVGTLVLSAASTYSGGTVVSNGTLLVNNPTGSGTGAGAVTVASGATLGGSGTIVGSVTLQSGASATNPAGTYLTISGAVVLNGNPMTVGSASALGVGDYLLITNTSGGITGSFASGVTVGGAGLAPSLSATIMTTSNAVTLHVASAAPAYPSTGTNITFTPITGGNTFDLTWPAEYIGWQLQSNAVDVSLTNYWFLVPGSTTTNKVTITISPSLTNVFYRMWIQVP